MLQRHALYMFEAAAPELRDFRLLLSVSPLASTLGTVVPFAQSGKSKRKMSSLLHIERGDTNAALPAACNQLARLVYRRAQNMTMFLTGPGLPPVKQMGR
jgi:hypothetical protein